MLSLPWSRCLLCEEIVQGITHNQHVLWASLNLEYYWCQSQGSVAIPKGCFAMSHVPPIHMGAYHWHVLLWNVNALSVTEVEQVPIKVLHDTSMFYVCSWLCAHVYCALYCWQCAYCIVCLCLHVCVVWIFCVLLSLYCWFKLMQMNGYSILCLLLIWYWRFLLCNVNALSLSSLFHFH